MICLSITGLNYSKAALIKSGAAIFSAFSADNKILVNELNATDGAVAATSYKNSGNVCTQVVGLDVKSELVFMALLCTPNKRLSLFNITSGVFTGTLQFSNPMTYLDYELISTVSYLFDVRLKTSSVILVGEIDSSTKAYATESSVSSLWSS